MIQAYLWLRFSIWSFAWGAIALELHSEVNLGSGIQGQNTGSATEVTRDEVASIMYHSQLPPHHTSFSEKYIP